MNFILLSIFALFFSSCQNSSASSTSHIDTYLNYLDTYPNLGPLADASLGEIEIVRDKDKILEIERKTGRKAGIVAQDKYWIWINDPVKFPSGTYGIYGRLLWISSLTGAGGVAVLPILPDGKIVLNRNFRHATRTWEYELPRGARDSGETAEQTAVREVKEETGMVIKDLFLLGKMHPDTGITNTCVPIYLAKVIAKEEAGPETSEAVAGIEAFSVAEIKQGLVDGYLSVTIDGKSRKINLRDSFLAFALLQAEIRSLL